jgi:tryptophanyl-tRNA synthetase
MNPQAGQKSRLFSGIKPTNALHLGNYLGAIRNWLTFQDEFESIFCAVNLHAITVPHDPKLLREQTDLLLAVYLASGLDPKRSILFVQSDVPAHSELTWILTCRAYMGELSRMTQFKDKSAKEGTNIPAGLFSYPILMAADILLYRAQLVPVGEDQKQHIELARDLGQRMNTQFPGKDKFDALFTIPEPFIPPVGARIMSLLDADVKMSKSDENPNATIFLLDDEATILKKFKRAVTDSLPTVASEGETLSAGVLNLMNIQAAVRNIPIAEIHKEYAGRQYGYLKVETGEHVAKLIKPIREEAERYLKDRAELRRVAKLGADRARALAEPTLKQVYERVGF